MWRVPCSGRMRREDRAGVASLGRQLWAWRSGRAGILAVGPAARRASGREPTAEGTVGINQRRGGRRKAMEHSGGAAADGVAEEQPGHREKGAALVCAVWPWWCGSPCSRSPAWLVALDPSKGQGTAREATRETGAEITRGPRSGKDRRSRVGVGVRRCKKWGHWTVLRESSSRRYATSGAARRHKVMAMHACR
nr:unnamed protein product [Digitaria exilis]